MLIYVFKRFFKANLLSFVGVFPNNVEAGEEKKYFACPLILVLYFPIYFEIYFED